jgi:hypothetical protein
MNNVFVVFTVHKDCGFANSASLLDFLERHRPEVIFLELPPYAYDRYYSLLYTRSSLESIAVRQYREKQPFVKLIPVDMTVSNDFIDSHEEWFEEIARMNPEMCRILDANMRDQEEIGFSYLNSDRCSQRWVAIYAAIKDTIDGLNDPELSERFESWSNMHEHRDQTMISNINQYCREHDFERGVFLIGAAHRRSIIEKLTMADCEEENHIGWSWQE